MKRTVMLLLTALLMLGCADRDIEIPDEGVYHSNAAWHLQVGRDYAAQGRYELAREHLLMALASNTETDVRNAIAHELKSVDMMIQTKR